MAYTDIIHSEYNLLTLGGSTVNFAFDSPVSADGSPHMTHICFQFDCTMDANIASLFQDGASMVSDIRIKVGSQELINFQQTLTADDTGATDFFLTGLSVLAQKVGGYATVYQAGATQFIADMCLPFGLDASRSHRFNITLTSGNALTFCGTGAIAALSASTLNIIAHYGTSTEATLYGSRQDFTLTNGAQRNFTIFGKPGWAMLGILNTGNMTAIAAVADDFTDIRLKNGAFRQLTLYDWRIINGDAWNSPLQAPNATLGSTQPVYKGEQTGAIFLDLRRLTAGSNAELLGTAAASVTTSFFPVWVAPVGAKTPTPPRQTVSTTESTTEAVVEQSAYGN